jgi:hypothetical protein
VTNGILTCEAVAEQGLVERYVSGRLSHDQGLEALEAHVLTCETCREEVRLALVVRAELAEQLGQAPGRGADAARRRLRPGLWIGLAAAAALVLVVQQGTRLELTPGAHRAPAQGAAPAPIPRRPVGAVSTAPQLQWSGFAGADRYRVRMFNSDGDVLWEGQGTDTALSLPDSVRLTPGQRYYWSVAGRVGVDHWVDSRLTEFVIRPDRP